MEHFFNYFQPLWKDEKLENFFEIRMFSFRIKDISYGLAKYRGKEQTEKFRKRFPEDGRAEVSSNFVATRVSPQSVARSRLRFLFFLLSHGFGSFPGKVTRKSAATAGTRRRQLSRFSLPHTPSLSSFSSAAASRTLNRGLKYRRQQPRLNNSAAKFRPQPMGKLFILRRESRLFAGCETAFENDGNLLCVTGFALMRIVEVYKEIQEQEMNIVSTFSHLILFQAYSSWYSIR